MAGYRPTQIRKPSDETDFERNCVVLFREILADPNVKRVGTRGQKQKGVDIIGKRSRDSKQPVGIQCKLKSDSSKLTDTEVRNEVTKALTFRPKLTEYFIVTTSKDDTSLDELAKQLSQDQQANGRKIHIEVWGWDTLCEKINQSEAAKDAFDPGFSPSIAAHGQKLDAVIEGQAATNEQLMALAAAIQRAPGQMPTQFPPQLADRELKEGLSKALRRRGFVGTNIGAELAVLAERAIDGDLSLGFSTLRAEICDRAARANIAVQGGELSRRFRDCARQLDPARDLRIANAVLKEAYGDPDGALRDLRSQHHPDGEIRAAILVTFVRRQQRDGALEWVRSEGLTAEDFSAAGAMNLVLTQIGSGEFDAALQTIRQTPEAYFTQCPALYLIRAQLRVASTLPADQKTALFQGLPTNPSVLQPAIVPGSEEEIVAASSDLQHVLAMLGELDLGHLARFLSEFDLWLGLQNPATKEAARTQLATEIADPEKTLHRVRLALAYDIPFNREALERHLAAQKQLGGWKDLVALTEELPELQKLDDDYTAARSWALAEIGRLLEARDIARQLLARRNVAGDRELAVMVAIETGDWGNLQAILAREATRADNLPPNDLMRLARLAHEAGSPYVDQFRDMALRKAPDDPEINLSAYALAIERGAEYQGSQAHTWFQKAIAQSGTEGPVRSVSIRELVEEAPTWNKHRENVDQMLRRGDVPLFIGGKAIRRQVFDLTLGQALRNSDPSDKRIRYPVLAFSGAQPERDITAAKSIALDITAIITLDFLGLLDATLARFDQIVIAPKTLSMTFLERQFLRFHQPSEIAKAQRLQALIGAGRLKLISSEAGPPSRPVKEMGPALAILLAAAEREGGLVVRSAPVFKLSSFLEERVDMHQYAAVLTDTLTVVSYLSKAGRLDSERKERAETYLRQVDSGWDASQAISESSKLYLDELTVNYLNHVGLLEVLTHSVAAVFVHETLDIDNRNILRYSSHTEELLTAIERIRSVIAAHVETGRIRFSARHLRDTSADEEKDGILESAPTLDLMSDLSRIEVVVADDRCLNKLPNWTDGAGRSAFATSSLSVLAALRTSGQLDNQAYWRARHKLRAAAYYAVPVELDELMHQLASAPVVNGAIRETPELRGVRESISLPRINDVFVPWEEPWLNRVRFAVYRVIHETWVRSTDVDRARAEADWLWSILPNPLAWCLSPGIETVWAAARQQLAIQVGLMLTLIDASNELRDRYFAWLQDVVIRPLEERHPDIWKAVLEFLKSYVIRLTEPRSENADSAP